MYRETIFASFTMISLILFTSCGQENVEKEKSEAPEVTSELPKPSTKEPHQYGGWFCPDNLGGFPPVDIQNLENVPVVNDRLPTKEETRNGTSLMFIDKEEHPDARTFDIELPQVARIYSSHNGMTELVIVIQAIVVKEDTVVGFRYPNGGNGTAWYSDVQFLSKDEVEEIGSSPFTYQIAEIDANKEQVWKAFTASEYAQELGEKFDVKDFLNSYWTSDSEQRLNLEKEGVSATGIITTLWGNLYLHIDYEIDGFHYSEKMMLSEKENKSELHLVAGPFPYDFKKENSQWEKWIQDVRNKSEKM